MDTFSATNEILKNLQAIYKYTDDIMHLTKDMENAMITDDDAMFGRLLDMRGDVMIKVDSIKVENKKIIAKMPEPLKSKILGIVEPKGKQVASTVKLDNPLETNIFDTQKSTMDLLKKVIALDNSIKNRIRKGGVDSKA